MPAVLDPATVPARASWGARRAPSPGTRSGHRIPPVQNPDPASARGHGPRPHPRPFGPPRGLPDRACVRYRPHPSESTTSAASAPTPRPWLLPLRHRRRGEVVRSRSGGMSPVPFRSRRLPSARRPTSSLTARSRTSLRSASPDDRRQDATSASVDGLAWRVDMQGDEDAIAAIHTTGGPSCSRMPNGRRPELPEDDDVAPEFSPSVGARR